MHTKWKTLSIYLAMIFSTAILILSCSEDDSYIIGAIGPLAGEYANYGVQQVDAIQMAITKFNQAGGINGKHVKLVSKDSNGDPDTGLAAVEDMIEKDKITALLGPEFSSVALKIAGTLTRAQIPMITGSATSSELSTKGSFIFRTIPSDALQALVLGSYMANILDYDTMAILHTDEAYSFSLAKDVKRIYEGAGGKVLLSLQVESLRPSYRYEIYRLKAANPDVLFLPNYIQDTAVILKDIAAIGWKVQVVSGDTFQTIDFSERVGTLGEGVIYTSYQAPSHSESIEFQRRYYETYGIQPDVYAYNTYDAANIVLRSMRDAYGKYGHVAGELIREFIQNTEYEGVSGHIKFDHMGDVLKGVSVIQIRESKHVPLGNFTADGDQIILLP